MGEQRKMCEPQALASWHSARKGHIGELTHAHIILYTAWTHPYAPPVPYQVLREGPGRECMGIPHQQSCLQTRLVDVHA